MILNPEILTIYTLDIIFFIFACIAFILSIKIVLHWNPDSTSQTQYKLEKQSYLTATIIKYIFLVKIPLFIFFIFTLDKISNILNGAMCAAGVVNATKYGTYLLILKIINLYIFAYWIVLNKEDVKYEEQSFVKVKFTLFIVAFFLLVGEIILEFLMFSSINPQGVVDCCGVIYSSSAGSYMSAILHMKHYILLSLFYGTYFGMLLFYFTKNRYLFSFSNILFIIISLISLIAFFGTYIYELPTHHCPFCFLQKDYDYIGYLLYILLFIGTFSGIITALIKFKKEDINKYFNISILFNTIYVGVISYFPIAFYLKNGVWL